MSSVACLPTDAGLDDRPLGAALAYAVEVKNVVVVAAAGNVGGPGQCPEQNPLTDPTQPGQPDWDRVKVVVSPAWYDDYVLTVGSVDANGAPLFNFIGPASTFIDDPDLTSRWRAQIGVRYFFQ